ncbi:MAG TPA: class I SAM-dependent methyltransferase, partial [Herpetosiphonaceae bacterium]
LGGTMAGARVLELGCGRGVGTEILRKTFGAQTVHALDLDPAMIRLAAARLRPALGTEVLVSISDAAQLPVPTASMDVVLDSAIIHHIPAWDLAVAEVARVLRPGGRFFFVEVTRHALERWSYRTFFDHPRERRFGRADFVAALAQHGIVVGDRVVERFFGDFLLGVGYRQPHAAERAR